MRNSFRAVCARCAPDPHVGNPHRQKKYSLKTLENATQFLEGRLTRKKHLAAQVKLIGAKLQSGNQSSGILRSMSSPDRGRRQD